MVTMGSVLWLPQQRQKMADVTTAEVFYLQTQGHQKQGWTNLQAGSPTPCHPTTGFTALPPLKKGAKCQWFCVLFPSTQNYALYYGIE